MEQSKSGDAAPDDDTGGLVSFLLGMLGVLIAMFGLCALMYLLN